MNPHDVSGHQDKAVIGRTDGRREPKGAEHHVLKDILSCAVNVVCGPYYSVGLVAWMGEA